MSMEKILWQLFDFQRFEGNASLGGVIDAVHARRAARELTPDETEWIAAAGTAEIKRNAEKKENGILPGE